MKQLSEFLSTNVDVKNREFPNGFDIKEITNFLDETGYEKIETKSSVPYNILKEFEARYIDKKVYCVEHIAKADDYQVYNVYIFDGHEITKEYPVLDVTAVEDGYDVFPGFYYSILMWADNSDDELVAKVKFNDYDESRKNINKFFDRQ